MRLHPLKHTDYVQAKALLHKDQASLAALWHWRDPASFCLKWHGQVVGFHFIAKDVHITGYHPDWRNEIQRILQSKQLQHPSHSLPNHK